MKLINQNKLFRLFLLLSNRRKKQIRFLLILIVINGIFESLSVSAIIPFLKLITSNGDQFGLKNISQFIPFDFSSQGQALFVITFLFCIFILISTFLRIFNNWFILRLTAKIDIDLGNMIFQKNIFQNYKTYTKKSSSEIISLIVEKVALSSSAIYNLLTILLSAIIASSIIISLVIYNWKIVLISFLSLYVFYLIIIKQVRNVLISNGKILSTNDPLRIKIIQESFMGFRDIVINNTEKVYFNLFNKYNSAIKIKSYDSQFFTSSPKFLIEGITLFLITIVGYIFSKSTTQSKDFIPLIGSFAYGLQRLLPLSQQAYAAWASYKIKSASINDVLNELENEKDHVNVTSKKDKILFNSNILLKNISYGYNSTDLVFRDINLTIKKGEHIGIFGETGSGKSTLLDVLMGLLPPLEGKILIDGIDIYKTDCQKSWTSKISHVPQNIFLKEASIAENIAFGKIPGDINYELLKKVSKIAEIYNFIQSTEDGFQTLVGERGIRLSGGQRQRIAIARAIYSVKDVLVLDESTSALDEKTEKKVLDSIFNNYENLTILMVTHRLTTLNNWDRVLEINSNGVVEEK